jgi:hypothetical protein
MKTYPTQPCRSCSQPMIWAVSATTGGAQPIDPDPTPDGTVELESRGPLMAPLAHGVPPAKRAGRTDLRLAHHSTCGQGATWRRNRRSA